MTPTSRLRRPFNWGIVIITDSESRDPLPDLPVSPNPVAMTSTGAVIVVRHAQDVDDVGDEEPAHVTIDVRAGAADTPVTASKLIEVPGGVLHIGDAEHFDAIPLAPGSYQVAILTSPTEHAEHITIWLKPGP